MSSDGAIQWKQKEDKEKEAFEFVQHSKSKAFVDLMASNIDIKPNIRDADPNKDKMNELIKIEKNLLKKEKSSTASKYHRYYRSSKKSKI